MLSFNSLLSSMLLLYCCWFFFSFLLLLLLYSVLLYYLLLVFNFIIWKYMVKCFVNLTHVESMLGRECDVEYICIKLYWVLKCSLVRESRTTKAWILVTFSIFLIVVFFNWKWICFFVLHVLGCIFVSFGWYWGSEAAARAAMATVYDMDGVTSRGSGQLQAYSIKVQSIVYLLASYC